MTVDNAVVAKLVETFASGDPHQFHMVALQTAAHMARGGDARHAKAIRNMVDGAMRTKSYLPPYSGVKTICAKCESMAGPTVKYVKEGDCDFLERECARCGYVWYECCADVKSAS